MNTTQPNSFSKTRIAIRLKVLNLSPSVPLFVLAVLFKGSLTILSGYFYIDYIWLNLVAISGNKVSKRL